MGAKRIKLEDMIVNLRRELLNAQERAEKENLKFRVDDIELEIQVAVTKEAEGETGVQFWVYNAGAKGKIAGETVHKLRLKLTPLPADGGDLLVGDRDQRPTD